MFSDLFVGPTTGRQHTNGKLCGGQVVGHIVAGHRVMHFAPSHRKAVGNINDALKILWPAGLNDGFQHPAQQTVVFAQALDEIVRTGDFPRGEEIPSLSSMRNDFQFP